MAKANIATAVIILLLTISAHSCIGILSASLVIVFKKAEPFTRFFETASYLLCGIYYPLAVLPGWLRRFSCVLPLTYSLQGMRRAVLLGEPVWHLWRPVFALSAFTAVMLPASILFFRLCIAYAKRAGSLAQY